jgi:preprotein translocase subunit SecA
LQLRGRSGRQGDPGSTRYFLSLEDNLFRIFGGDRIKGMMSAFKIEDLPIESNMLTSALDEAQRKVESYFFDIRKQLFDYDQVLNTQRDRVYADRRAALEADALESLMLEYAERTVDDILEANIQATMPPEEWPLDALAAKMKQYCVLLEDLTGEVLAQAAGGDYEALRQYLRKRGSDAYRTKVAEVDVVEPGLMRKAERFFVLAQTDSLWKEHLMAIKFLQQAVSLRGYAQRDPLVEYKLEGYQLFLEMTAQIRRNVIYNVYCFAPEKAAVGGAGNGSGAAENGEEKKQSTSRKKRNATVSA